MKSSRRGLVTLVCAALLVAGAAFAAQAGSGATTGKAAKGGSLTVWLWTHAAGGLTENDFILAAKIDRL